MSGGTHVMDEVPSTPAEKSPLGSSTLLQLKHRPPVWLVCPAGQGVHSPPAREEVPAAQGAHMEVPATAVLPAGHGWPAAPSLVSPGRQKQTGVKNYLSV